MNKDFNKFYKPKNHLGNELVALNGDGKIDNNFLNIQAPSVSEDLNTIASSEWVDEQIKNATAVLDTDIQNVKTEVANTVLTYSIPFSSLDALKNNYNNLDSVKISELRKCIFLVESAEDKNLYEEYICVNAKDVDTLTPVFTRLGAVETAFATQEIPGSVKLVAEVDSDNFSRWYDEVNTDLSGVTVPTKGFALAPYALKDVYEKIKNINSASDNNLSALESLKEELTSKDNDIEEKFDAKVIEIQSDIDEINTILGDTAAEDSIFDRLNDLEKVVGVHGCCGTDKCEENCSCDNLLCEVSHIKSGIELLQNDITNGDSRLDKVESDLINVYNENIKTLFADCGKINDNIDNANEQIASNKADIELLKSAQTQQNVTLTNAISSIDTRLLTKFEELDNINADLTNSYNEFTEEINDKINVVDEKVTKLNDIISYNFYRRETFTNGVVTVRRSDILQSIGIEDLDPMNWTIFVNGVITHADYDGNTTFTTQQVYPSVEITREADSGEILYIISVGETHGTTSRVSYTVVKSFN